MTQEIKRKAIELGFDLVGVTDASPIAAEQSAALATWLQCGFAGQMDYMHRNLQKRIDPAKLMDGAKSVVVTGLNYTPPDLQAGSACKTQPTGRIANYALYEDYHQFVRQRLRELISFLNSLIDTGFDFKICVDSAPVAERALAVRAGLGFIGKNHMLINPELGCQIFLGEIVTSLELEIDEPTATDCLSCEKCLHACPTGALRPDGQFDAGRCINYLTIEHKGPIPPELAESIGDRIFGCDECVLACPYQKNSPSCADRQFRFYPERTRPGLNEILAMDAESFQARFGDSPIRRPGLEGLKRNARICLANAARR